ncbi:MAG: hypothetical protein RLZZ245_3211 [Verrucomicrobiota bacterium]
MEEDDGKPFRINASASRSQGYSDSEIWFQLAINVLGNNQARLSLRKASYRSQSLFSTTLGFPVPQHFASDDGVSEISVIEIDVRQELVVEGRK